MKISEIRENKDIFFFSAFFMDDLQECRCDRILPGKSFFCREQFSAGYCLERFISLGNSSLKGTACFFYFSGREQFSAGYCLEKYFLIGNYSLKNTAIFFFGGIVPPKKKMFCVKNISCEGSFLEMSWSFKRIDKVLECMLPGYETMSG